MIFALGIDSTDSNKGGCTTWTFSRVLKNLYQADPDILFYDYPHLIRLNPNIPFKTRGNAALSAVFDTKVGLGDLYEAIYQQVLGDYQEFRELEPNKPEKLPGIILLQFDSLEAVVQFKLANKDLYKKCLQTFVKYSEIKKILENYGKNMFYGERSIVGAFGALIADHSIDSSFELITYRQRQKFGKEREFSVQSLMDAINEYPSTFSSYDFESKRELIAPAGPDPVFCGIRGDDPSDLLIFFELLEIYEKISHAMLVRTNQGTNAHVIHPNSVLSDFQVFSGRALVSRNPEDLPGGHVKLRLRIADTEEIDTMVFQPTKSLRDASRDLRIGDQIYLHGNTKTNEFGRFIALEYFSVIFLADEYLAKPPICHKCQSGMTSAGKLAGYKCKTCNNREIRPILQRKKRKLRVGQQMKAVPSAQRHLTRPLKREYRRNPQKNWAEMSYFDIIFTL